jgi:hypothetical protein
MFGTPFLGHGTSRPKSVNPRFGKKISNAMACVPVMNTMCAIGPDTMPIESLMATMNRTLVWQQHSLNACILYKKF